ncbi:MAG: LON peptidase substrate-binding domain-containing protein [Acidobacteria bacterium]|nr:LON peptidase substrate-binding domain-containing protein [Acidobacteriota bacterium]
MLPAILPLFPLARTVLFPRTFLPLHIFEPRYQAMTREVLGTHHHFLLALATDPEASDPLPPGAPISTLGTLTRIVRAEPMVDGRWNLLVQGILAVDIQEVETEAPYRQGTHRPHPFENGSPWSRVDKQGFFEALEAYARSGGIQGQLQELLDLDLDEDVLLNTLGLALDFDPVERQFLLESGSLASLAGRLVELIRFKMTGPRREGIA